jgi:hypothetical protein
MSDASLRELIVLASAGIGLLLFSGLRFVCGRWPRYAKVGSTALIIILTSLLPLASGGLIDSAATAGLIVVFAGALVLAGSGRTAAAIQSFLTWVRRPGVRVGALATMGAALIIGAYVKFDLEDEARIDRDDLLLDELISQPSTRAAPEVLTATDLGRQVRVRALDELRPTDVRTDAEQKVMAEFHSHGRVIRIAPVNDSCNCHGWVFTGGRYWVSQIDVEHILVDNGYEIVTDPRPGDLAIYRDSREISHTGVVRAVIDGMPPLVEGKWGWMGVFLHPAGDSLYGINYKFYRSPRDGHLLVGLDAVPNSKEVPEKLSGAQ